MPKSQCRRGLPPSLITFSRLRMENASASPPLTSKLNVEPGPLHWRSNTSRSGWAFGRKEIPDRGDVWLVEALRPQMIAGLGVDKLDINAHTAATALDASLQDVADVQLAADLLQIDMFSLIA
jgi:hypothetical protein